MRGTSRKSFFYRSLGFYLLILFIPSLFLGLSGYSDIVSVMEKEVTSGHEDMLVQIRESIDTKMLELNRIAAEISANPDLTPYALKQGFYHTLQIKPLLRYRVANEFLKEVLLYVKGSDYLISSESTYPLSLFNRSVYKFEYWTPEQLAHALDAESRPVLRPAEYVSMNNGTQERIVAYSIPIPINSREPHGTVLFLISESSLLGYMKYDQTVKTGNTVVLDEHKTPIASLNRRYMDDPSWIGLLADDGGAGTRVVDKGRERLLVSRTVSPQTGWTYVTFVPADDVLRGVHQVGKKWLSFALLITAVGIVAIFGVMRFSYNPIRRLVKLAETKWAQAAQGKLNELEVISAALDQMAKSNEEKDARLLQSRSAVRSHLLSRLLKGEFDGVDSFNAAAREVGLAFPPGTYGVVVFDGPAHEPAWKAALADALDGRVEGGLTVYGRESLEKHQWIAVYGADEETPSGADAAGPFARAKLEVQQRCGVPLTVGIGNRYAETAQIGKSYIEASTAVDFKLIKGRGETIRFSDVMELDAMRPIPHLADELERLKYVIRLGDADKVNAVIAQISDKIKRDGTSLVIARCLCYDVVNTLVKALYDEDKRLAESMFPNVAALLQFETVEQLSESLAASSARWCDLKRTNERGGELLDALTGYIDRHYESPSFSVQALADFVSLSPSYVSRYFKEKTGKTVSDYVHQQRIERAKRMLETRDYPVKDIVQQIGYYDASSFIRKFKNAVGVTPGEYRRQVELREREREPERERMPHISERN
ncbi:helix-turn-helix domain-containing protein [Paenibacillus flagellatus]|uniref:helix-turn-helix domain-containing protein n=1 Tax=Paenibacillus flagellatus TaxID=2211139 RepID=UPI0013051D69|nr:helix-turn-helix domain-containing protein [Paenibacillus flagellatus]